MAAELAPVGVPLIRPVVGFRIKDAGSAPELMDHEYGLVPPLAVSVCEYAAPTVPLGRDTVVTFKATGETIKEKSAETAELAESCTFMTIEDVPATVGVPVIVPVVEFKVSPAGSGAPVLVQV